MGLLTFLVSLLFLVISCLKNRKKILMPTTLFFLLWTFILFLSLLNLYNIFKPSTEAYFLILLMLFFFFLGSVIAENSKKLLKKTNYIVKIKYNLIYFLLVLFIIFTLVDCIIVVKNLLNGVPMHTIRRWRMGTFGVDVNPILSRRSFAEEIFRSVVLTPFETLVPPIAAYMFFKPGVNVKRKYIFLISSIIVLVLSSVAGGGGRLGFIYYFGCFLLAYMFFAKTNVEFNKKKYKKYIILAFVLGFGIVFGYTQIRTSSGFMKQMYTYFALPPTLLSLWLPKLSGCSYTYGMLTTFGFHSYIFRGFDSLGLNGLVPQIYNDAFQHLLNAEKFYQVGYGVGNAFVTPIYYFFIDGSYIFVCLASLLFGFLCMTSYKKILNNTNIRTFIFYALMMYGVFLTFIRIQTAIPAYIISFALVFLLFGVSKKITHS